MVHTGEAAPSSQPPSGQGQTHGLPAPTSRLQDGNPVCLLSEYVPVCLSVCSQTTDLSVCLLSDYVPIGLSGLASQL